MNIGNKWITIKIIATIAVIIILQHQNKMSISTHHNIVNDFIFRKHQAQQNNIIPIQYNSNMIALQHKNKSTFSQHTNTNLATTQNQQNNMKNNIITLSQQNNTNLNTTTHSNTKLNTSISTNYTTPTQQNPHKKTHKTILPQH